MEAETEKVCLRSLDFCVMSISSDFMLDEKNIALLCVDKVETSFYTLVRENPRSIVY